MLKMAKQSRVKSVRGGGLTRRPAYGSMTYVGLVSGQLKHVRTLGTISNACLLLYLLYCLVEPEYYGPHAMTRKI